jgi:hypothetical protein
LVLWEIVLQSDKASLQSDNVSLQFLPVALQRYKVVWQCDTAAGQSDNIAGQSLPLVPQSGKVILSSHKTAGQSLPGVLPSRSISGQSRKVITAPAINRVGDYRRQGGIRCAKTGDSSSGMVPGGTKEQRHGMARYDDPAAPYDSGLLYDAPDGPQTQRKRMAKIKLGLTRLSPDDVVSLANQIKTAMTGNANFTTPNPTLASLGTLITAATTKVAAQKAAQMAAKQATDDRDVAIDSLIASLTSLADYVANVSGGDAVKIESAGMSVKAAAAPVGPLDTVQNLSVTAGDTEGRLDLQWDPVRGTKNYQVQSSTDPNVPANWRLVDSCSGSKLSLTGLTSGDKLWFRVRAKAPKPVNDGAWSDPATKIVP